MGSALKARVPFLSADRDIFPQVGLTSLPPPKKICIGMKEPAPAPRVIKCGRRWCSDRRTFSPVEVRVCQHARL